MHDSFLFQTVSDYLNSKKNKCMKAYSTAYEFHSNLYEESREVRKPSRKFSKLREEIMGKWEHVFKEELEPTDRMRVVKPVKLKLKEGYINLSFCSKPFDTPFHLRTMYEIEIKRALDAELPRWVVRRRLCSLPLLFHRNFWSCTCISCVVK